MATKVLLNGRRATAVETVAGRGKRPALYRAQKEVILAAGAFNS